MVRWSLLEGVSALDPEAWNALVGDASPFLEWEWLASLEEAGCVAGENGWLARPLVAREGSRLRAACPLYVKAHSEGEFVFDFDWADAAEHAGIRYYPKLLVGVPFTPVGGARILTAPGEDRIQWVRRFAGALRDLCHEHGFSGVHVNFCLEEELRALEEAGYLPRVGFQYHWRNRGYRSFEDYLGALRSKRRNQIRRERRALRSQGIEVEVRTGTSIPEDWLSAAYRFYRSTVERHPWGRPYLNARFFEQVARRFRDRLCLVMARRGTEKVAGAFNVQKGDSLYGRYWGATCEIRNLHFEVCYYAGIEHCIRTGLERFEPGAGGDYKQVRGFDAEPTWSAHHLADPALAEAVKRYLERERDAAHDAIAWLREHSARKASL